MITKVTKDNKGLYDALFAQAEQEPEIQAFLQNEEVKKIDSLDRYFSVFKTLADLNDVYKVLPLDEPTFDIDADTRVINVPTAFKKNGISVQGDQIAEILYFTIDRYFDNVDLYDPVTSSNPEGVHVIIQWEAVGADKVTRQGISPAILVDKTIMATKNKLLIGWAINNTITEAAGAVKFSVRFYRIQDNVMTFSLSTLTASATISAGLDFKFSGALPTVDVYSQDADILKRRYKNSVYDGTSQKAASPVFLVEVLTDENDIIDHITINLIDYSIVDLDEVSDGVFTHKFAVSAEPDPDDGGQGSVTYEWFYAPLGGTYSSLGNDAVYYEYTKGFASSDDFPLYVLSTVNGVTTATEAEISNGDDVAAFGQTLYTKMDGITATATGDYYVTATVWNGLAQKSKDSRRIRIPGPGELTLTYPEGQEQAILTNGKTTLSISGTTKPSYNSDVDTTPNNDTMTYVWTLDEVQQKKDTKVAQKASSKLDVEVAEEDLALYDKTFFVSATADRNGDHTEAQIKSFRVTAPASEVEITPVSEAVDLIGDKATIRATVKVQDILSDSITYSWYKQKVEEGENPNDISNDTIVLDDNNKSEFTLELNSSGLGNAEITVTAAGKYYCIATNHVNGTTAQVVSERIMVA